LTILLVEQRVVEALELCDRGYVLETGRVVLEGPREACWPTRECSAPTGLGRERRPLGQ
jgi:ABC-type branched-subunit amino acid transport system ATPase component